MKTLALVIILWLATLTAHAQKRFRYEFLDTTKLAVLKQDTLFVFSTQKEFSKPISPIQYNGQTYSFKYVVYDFGQFWVRIYNVNQVKDRSKKGRAIRNKYELLR